MTSGNTSLDQWLADAALHRRQNHLQRNRKALSPTGQMMVSLGGQALVNFSSNDYLGLANDETLAQAVAHYAAQYGVGSGASALVTGYSEVHQALEEELAEFLQRDRVLLCSSGYQANLAVLSSLAGRKDTIIQDRLCHASLIDGAKLSGAKLRRYPHLDIDGLERQLKQSKGENTLLVTDGIFSMDGDRAPLVGLSKLSRQFGAWLVVDDAHGVGVSGPEGRGSVAAQGLGQDDVPVLVGTLGKAFGCSGAFIAGGDALVDHILNEGRTYLFTTAISPAIAGAGRTALKMVQSDQWRREKLNERIRQFRDGAKALGLQLMESDTPIQPLLIGSAENALNISALLQEKGLLVTAIRPPTVPAATSRLRITLSATHKASQVTKLLEALSECMDKS